VKDATIAGNRKDVETAEEPICVSVFRRWQDSHKGHKGQRRSQR